MKHTSLVRAAALIFFIPFAQELGAMQAPSCADGDLDCPSGRTGELGFSDSFGMQPGGCDTCIQRTIDGLPPGEGCLYSGWHSASHPQVPQLELPKFVPPGAGDELVQVDLKIRGTLCGVLRGENRDPLNGCLLTMVLSSAIQVSGPSCTVPDGPPLPVTGFPAFPLLMNSVTFMDEPGAFDGVVDFMGPSGRTVVFDPQQETVGLRVTDPALLAQLTDANNDGIVEMLLFDHSADDASTFSGCAPHTFLSDPFAGIEIEVRYVFCDATAFCDASDGSLASCPCSNPGAPDSGCDNAQGTGGVELTLVGQQTAPANRATVVGAGFPNAGAPGVQVLRGTAPDASGPAVFGDGLLCIAPPLVRLGGALAQGGTSLHTFGHGAMAGAGVFYYQLWFRSTPVTYCDPSAAFNLSSGRALTW